MKLIISNLWLKRGETNVFKNLNLSFSNSALFVVQGPNGSGKTTLLKLLAGIIKPNKGQFKWYSNDKLITIPSMHFLSHKEGISLALTPLENIRYILQLHGQTFDSTKVHTVLDAFQLLPLKHTLCKKLSLGQRRKVGLSAVILAQKQLWLLDEPFNALDDVSAQQLSNYIIKHGNQGNMVILSSHQAMDTAYKQIRLEAGVT